MQSKCRGSELLGAPAALLVKGRIDEVHIFLVHFFLGKAQAFAKALKMDDFSGTQEFDDIVYIRVIGEAQNVVISHTRFLLCCQILGEVCNQVALDRHGGGAPRKAGGCRRIYARRVVNEIGVKAARPDVLFREITGQLVDDCANHLQVTQFLGTYLCIENVPTFQS